MPGPSVTHRTLAELEAGFATLPAAPRDAGVAALIAPGQPLPLFGDNLLIEDGEVEMGATIQMVSSP